MENTQGELIVSTVFNANCQLLFKAIRMENTVNNAIPRIVRVNEVQKIAGISRPTLYRYLKNGHFPKPIKLGPKSVGWLESKLRAWVQSRIDARDSVAA